MTEPNVRSFRVSGREFVDVPKPPEKTTEPISEPLRLRQSSASDKDSDASSSVAAAAHGELRYLQGYTPAMLVHESRILQVAIFGTLQGNLNCLDFSLPLPDVMAIADEIDPQLTQAMDGYMNVMRKSAAA